MTLQSVDDIERVAVVGAGEMGRGIAAVAALAGYDTYLNDIDEEQLENGVENIEWSYSKLAEKGSITEAEAEAAFERITPTLSLEEAAEGADFVTEAAAEQQAIKRDIFTSLDEFAPPHAILSTNTSGLNITDLAEVTDRPELVVGTHWFNPPMLMDLVEVIRTEYVDDRVVDISEALIESFDKTPIICRRDIPMFIVNRCMRPYGESAAWQVQFGNASVEEIDSAMKYREGFPMGPFELTDFTGGIQIRVESEEDHLSDPRPMSYDSRYCPLLHDLYERGDYGRKSGQGFYDYSEQTSPDISRAAGWGFDTLRVWVPIINEAAKMVQNDVASVEDIDTGARLGGNWPSGPLEKADEIGIERVVDAAVDIAAEHTRLGNKAEVLPCDLLIRMAKDGETFY